MRVRFWGVRGSTPMPHRDHLGYGGNTACVEVRTDGGEILILDAGTGIRALGAELMRESAGTPIRANVLFSHFHLDHIQGLPFFEPLYSSENHITFYYGEHAFNGNGAAALNRFMSSPYVAIDFSALPARHDAACLGDGSRHIADAEIMVRRLNHPQGCVGYRITQGDRSLAYCTDMEPGPEWSRANFEDLAGGVGCLIVDAQFTPGEYARREGWGHSSWKESVESAVAVNAKRVILFHHDPGRDDAAIDRLVMAARQIHPNVVAAREGMEEVIRGSRIS